MPPTIKDYQVNIRWDEKAGYYIAEISEIPFCAADGRTQIEALNNLNETFAVLKETYFEDGMKIPAPNPRLLVSVAQLTKASPVVKVSKVAKLSGINIQTLAAKVRRGTEFSVSESHEIARALNGLGVQVTSFDSAPPFPDRFLEESSSSGATEVKAPRQLKRNQKRVRRSAKIG